MLKTRAFSNGILDSELRRECYLKGQPDHSRMRMSYPQDLQVSGFELMILVRRFVESLCRESMFITAIVFDHILVSKSRP